MIIDIPKVGEVEFPDSMSEQEINAAAKRLYNQANVPTKLTAGDVASQAITNFPSSFGSLVGNVVSAVTSPIETGKAVLDLGAGILQNVLPERLVQAIGEDKQSREVASKVGQFYVERYGSVEGAKRAIAEDPAGVLADISTVLSGGAMVAPKAVAQPLARAATTIDPLAAAVRATGKVASATGRNVVAPILGTTTGAGRESISQAFKAGQKGGESAEQFRANISGRADPTEILDIAKNNLNELNLAKQAEYRSGMVNIKNDKSILGFDDIEKSLQDATKKVTYKGQIKNATAAEKLQEAQQKVNTWKNLDPAEFHTPEGLDALKQQIGDVLETIDFTKQKVAYSAVSDVYKSIKSSIQKQAPTYAQTMKAYTDASDQITEIQKTLSLNNKASTDTALRKLQSLVRDNVQTNYGQRLNLAKELEVRGGQPFMPGISGQALSSLTPRSLASQGSLGTTAVVGTAVNPMAFALAPLASPRLVGEAAYGMGAANRGASNFGQLVPPLVDPRTYNLLYQSGQIPGLLEEQ